MREWNIKIYVYDEQISVLPLKSIEWELSVNTETKNVLERNDFYHINAAAFRTLMIGSKIVQTRPAERFLIRNRS